MFNFKFTAMKRTSLIFATSLLMTAAISFTSCQKDDEQDPIIALAAEDSDIDSYFDEVMAETDELTLQDDGVKSSEMMYAVLAGQGTRTRKTSWEGDCRIDSVTYSDYVNPNARYERVKNGVMVIRTCGRYNEPEFERTVTFNNFTVNGNQIEGTKVISKTAEHQYQISLTNGKITFTDGTSYTRNIERTRTWVEGYNTPFFIWDDVYTLEGTATGVNRQGNAYTHQIASALVYKLSCRWIVQGVIEFSVGDMQATLDYGNGDCDYLAYVTVNGQTVEVKLR